MPLALAVHVGDSGFRAMDSRDRLLKKYIKTIHGQEADSLTLGPCFLDIRTHGLYKDSKTSSFVDFCKSDPSFANGVTLADAQALINALQNTEEYQQLKKFVPSFPTLDAIKPLLGVVVAVGDSGQCHFKDKGQPLASCTLRHLLNPGKKGPRGPITAEAMTIAMRKACAELDATPLAYGLKPLGVEPEMSHDVGRKFPPTRRHAAPSVLSVAGADNGPKAVDSPAADQPLKSSDKSDRSGSLRKSRDNQPLSPGLADKPKKRRKLAQALSPPPPFNATLGERLARAGPLLTTVPAIVQGREGHVNDEQQFTSGDRYPPRGARSSDRAQLSVQPADSTATETCPSLNPASDTLVTAPSLPAHLTVSVDGSDDDDLLLEEEVVRAFIIPWLQDLCERANGLAAEEQGKPKSGRGGGGGGGQLGGEGGERRSEEDDLRGAKDRHELHSIELPQYKAAVLKKLVKKLLAEVSKTPSPSKDVPSSKRDQDAEQKLLEAQAVLAKAKEYEDRAIAAERRAETWKIMSKQADNLIKQARQEQEESDTKMRSVELKLAEVEEKLRLIEAKGKESNQMLLQAEGLKSEAEALKKEAELAKAQAQEARLQSDQMAREAEEKLQLVERREATLQEDLRQAEKKNEEAEEKLRQAEQSRIEATRKLLLAVQKQEDVQGLYKKIYLKEKEAAERAKHSEEREKEAERKLIAAHMVQSENNDKFEELSQRERELDAREAAVSAKEEMATMKLKEAEGKLGYAKEYLQKVHEDCLEAQQQIDKGMEDVRLRLNEVHQLASDARGLCSDAGQTLLESRQTKHNHEELKNRLKGTCSDELVEATRELLYEVHTVLDEVRLHHEVAKTLKEESDAVIAGLVTADEEMCILMASTQLVQEELTLVQKKDNVETLKLAMEVVQDASRALHSFLSACYDGIEQEGQKQRAAREKLDKEEELMYEKMREADKAVQFAAEMWQDANNKQDQLNRLVASAQGHTHPAAKVVRMREHAVQTMFQELNQLYHEQVVAEKHRLTCLLKTKEQMEALHAMLVPPPGPKAGGPQVADGPEQEAGPAARGNGSHTRPPEVSRPVSTK